MIIIVIVFGSYALYITSTVYFMKYRFERPGAVFNMDVDIGSNNIILINQSKLL